mmetsp:Transcript_7059/g.22926  ORF Transcript_7059/g.22926 Transcript_7059/m.22926 type:complete len:217 (+) Transcript_7059:239-889(+)
MATTSEAAARLLIGAWLGASPATALSRSSSRSSSASSPMSSVTRQRVSTTAPLRYSTSMGSTSWSKSCWASESVIVTNAKSARRRANSSSSELSREQTRRFGSYRCTTTRASRSLTLMNSSFVMSLRSSPKRFGRAAAICISLSREARYAPMKSSSRLLKSSSRLSPSESPSSSRDCLAVGTGAPSLRASPRATPSSLSARCCLSPIFSAYCMRLK